MATTKYRNRPNTLRSYLGRVDDRFMGSPVELDPHDAILHALYLTAGEVAYCDAQISRLSEDELFERPLVEEYVEIGGKTVEISQRRDAEIITRWIYLRDNAADRMVKYAKIAIDAGIDERRVVVAERVADILAPLLSNLAEDLHLSGNQRAMLPDVLGSRLRELETTTMREAR